MSPDPAWKRNERQVASILGGRRRWLSRGHTKGEGDIEGLEKLEVDVKRQKTFGPRAARAALARMPANGKVRVVVHHLPRSKGPDAWRCYIDGADLWALLWTAPAHAGEAALVHDAGADRARGVMVSLALDDLARIVGRRG